jgi:hypothetical protein
MNRKFLETFKLPGCAVNTALALTLLGGSGAAMKASCAGVEDEASGAVIDPLLQDLSNRVIYTISSIHADVEFQDVDPLDGGNRANAISNSVTSDDESTPFVNQNEIAHQFLSVGGPENETNIFTDSRRAQNALLDIDMNPGEVYVAFINSTGNIETYDLDDPCVYTSHDGLLRMEDRYAVRERGDLSHISTRHMTPQGENRIYTPWDISYDSSNVRQEGAEMIQDYVYKAYSILKSLPSSAYRDHSVAEVIKPEFLMDFFMSENIPHENIDDPDLAIMRHNSLLIHVALNGDNAFRYRVSGVGASGPMQLMPSMYESLVNDPNSHYNLAERFNINPDFTEGSTDFVTAFVVAACLLDDIARSFKVYDRLTAQEPEDISDENYADLVGAYLMGAPNYHAVALSGELPQDYYNYMNKYNAINRLHE